MGGFIPAQDEQGWHDTGDLGYLTDERTSWLRSREGCHHHGGPQHLPTDIERAASRVEGVRPGCAVAVRWTPPLARDLRGRGGIERVEEPDEVHGIERQVAHEVVAEWTCTPGAT